VALGIFKLCPYDRFAPRRTGRPPSWMVGSRQAVRPNEVSGLIFQNTLHAQRGRDRTWHGSTSNAVCHGSLPVYFSRTSSSSYAETPTIPPLVRQSTFTPTFISQLSPMSHQQPRVLPHVLEPDTRPKLSQPYENIRPNEPSEPSELPQSSRSSQQSEPVPSPAASVLTLTDNISPVSSVGGASSYRTCEEESTRC